MTGLIIHLSTTLLAFLAERTREMLGLRLLETQGVLCKGELKQEPALWLSTALPEDWEETTKHFLFKVSRRKNQTKTKQSKKPKQENIF